MSKPAKIVISRIDSRTERVEIRRLEADDYSVSW